MLPFKYRPNPGAISQKSVVISSPVSPAKIQTHESMHHAFNWVDADSKIDSYREYRIGIEFGTQEMYFTYEPLGLGSNSMTAWCRRSHKKMFIRFIVAVDVSFLFSFCPYVDYNNKYLLWDDRRHSTHRASSHTWTGAWAPIWRRIYIIWKTACIIFMGKSQMWKWNQP